MRLHLSFVLALAALMVAPSALATPTAQEQPDGSNGNSAGVGSGVPPAHARCSELDPARLVALYDPASPDRAWGDVAAAHGASFANPLLARSGITYRGAALVYAAWISRAADSQPPVFITAEDISLDLCNTLHEGWERGNPSQIASATTILKGLVPQLWCEQLRAQAGLPPRSDNPYLLAVTDAFGPRGDGMAVMLFALTRETLGDALAQSLAQQGQQAARGALRTMDTTQCE
jgi:hypothetical protein